MVREPWFRLMALAIAFGLLGIGFMAIPVAMQTCVAIGFIALLASIYLGLRKRFSRDPYSLDTLREMVIEGTYNEDDVPEADDDADIYCMYCHHTYGARFKVCPHCGR